MSDFEKPKKAATLSWILYDFANTIYSMNVVSLYFAPWIISDLNQEDIFVSFPNSISMILVALTMPFLGEISDRLQRKMPFLVILTIFCVAATAGIGIIGIYSKDITYILRFVTLLYIIANYSYQSGLVFYNALMPAVSTPKTIGRISGYGVAIGYAGAAFGIMAVQPFVEGWFVDFHYPYIDATFKLPVIAAGGKVASFIPTALLFLVFAVPIFIFVREQPLSNSRSGRQISLRASVKTVLDSIINTKKYPGVLQFLSAHFLYSDSIQTIIIFMSVYSQVVIGFSSAETSLFFIAVIPAAIIGSAVAGILADHYGPKKTLVAVIAGWILCLLFVIFTNDRLIFWILGAFVGIFMGSTWSSDRPLLISLVPKDMLGEFFGLYSLAGKLAAISGPLIWSLVTWRLARYSDAIRYKAAIGALLSLMIFGFLILLKVPDNFKNKKSD